MPVTAILTILSDVLRRRFQINTMPRMGYQYKSIPDAVKVIVAREGLKGFYKGIAPNLLKVAPSMASSWLTFEVTRDFCLSLRPSKEDMEITLAAGGAGSRSRTYEPEISANSQLEDKRKQ